MLERFCEVTGKNIETVEFIVTAATTIAFGLTACVLFRPAMYIICKIGGII